MFTIEQSPFLHALGYAIGHSLWQMSLLWLVYTGIIYLQHWTSSQRYNLAVAAATTGFAWFLATLIYYSNNVTIGQENSLIESIPASEKLFSPTGKFVFFYHSAMATLRSLAPYFSCAYLVVMMLLSIRLANGFNEVKKLKTDGLSKASVDWRMFVKEHAALLGIKKPVVLYISNIASSPLTIGFWKPFILIPLASINQLTPQQLEAVLLHELAHIRRNDYLLNIVLQLTEITLFFNPFMRLLLKQARLERENCCDDYVLQFQYNATDYARALLAIEQHSVESILALGTNNQNEFQLLNRIKRMLAPERRAFNYKQQLGLLFIITILGLGFTVISPKQQTEKATTNKSIKIEEKKTEISVTETALPPAIDLIKKLEDIQQQFSNNIDPAIAKVKTKNIEAAIAKATDKLNGQIQPNISKIEAKALEHEMFAKDVNFNGQSLAMTALKLKEPSNAVWSKIIIPAIDEAVKMYAFSEVFGKEKWIIPFAPEAPVDPPAAPQIKRDISMERLVRTQQREMGQLQEKLNAEQKKQVREIEIQDLIADSIQVLFTMPAKPDGADYTAAIARSRKQAAIAPFRQRATTNNTYFPTAKGNFQFSYSNDNSNIDEEDDADNDDTKKLYGIDENKTRAVNNCECPVNKKTQIKTVTVFNGKAFSDKIKKVWADAQQNINKDWAEEIKEEALREIEKELKNIEHAEIKTHVTTKSGSNNKTITIEAEAM